MRPRLRHPFAPPGCHARRTSITTGKLRSYKSVLGAGMDKISAWLSEVLRFLHTTNGYIADIVALIGFITLAWRRVARQRHPVSEFPQPVEFSGRKRGALLERVWSQRIT